MEKVLIIDDDKDLRTVICDVLAEEGLITIEAGDGISGLRLFRKEMPDTVLLDLKMPYMSGIETLKEMMKIDATVPVIILTAFGDIQTAVEATRLGAYHFATKPPQYDELIVTVKRALERRTTEMRMQKADTALAVSLENMLGKSPAIKKVIDQIRQLAPTDLSVIVQGETGTGKTAVARIIHDMSPRAERSFVNVDIGVIPEHLVESELFGYKKGAFTGADRNKTGIFETAHGGTVLIDELENMSPHVQTKLLSFIDTRRIHALGGTRPSTVDVRVLAATNRDIRESVARKEFREDLFYRLGESLITLPPLRERGDDIPFFARKFIQEACSYLRQPEKDLSNAGAEFLKEQSWPGNLRELKTVMKTACLSTGDRVVDKDCVEAICSKSSSDTLRGSSLKDSVKQAEKKIIIEVLETTGGNRTRAAEKLQVSYRSLLAKMKEYGIH
jgi:two-component system response regulator AtoC